MHFFLFHFNIYRLNEEEDESIISVLTSVFCEVFVRDFVKRFLKFSNKCSLFSSINNVLRAFKSPKFLEQKGLREGVSLWTIYAWSVNSEHCWGKNVFSNAESHRKTADTHSNLWRTLVTPITKTVHFKFILMKLQQKNNEEHAINCFIIIFN